MTIMEMATELGRTIKNDPVIVRLNEASAAYEADAGLLALIDKYNAFSAQLETLREADEIDEAAAKAVENALDGVYDEIMEHPTMVAYTEAKNEADELMAAVSEEISFQITGKHSCHDSCGHESCDCCDGCH